MRFSLFLLALRLAPPRRLRDRGAAARRAANLGRDAAARRPRPCRPTNSGPGAGHAGEERTVAFIAQEFRRAGLQPGNQRQLVPGRAAGRDHRAGQSDAPRSAAARARPRLRLPHRLSSAPPTAPSPTSRSTNSDIVFVGYGINAPERGWNDYAGLDVRGKTVIILVNDPDWQTPGLKGPFNGRAMTYYGRWTYKFEEAARQGAAAAFIVHDTAPASYGWNVVENSWTGPAALHADPRTMARTRPR